MPLVRRVIRAVLLVLLAHRARLGRRVLLALVLLVQRGQKAHRAIPVGQQGRLVQPARRVPPASPVSLLPRVRPVPLVRLGFRVPPGPLGHLALKVQPALKVPLVPLGRRGHKVQQGQRGHRA